MRMGRRGRRTADVHTHTLTLDAAFPFKSPIPLGYAELMQDLLRQWGNTAELCSLCCQQACNEEEGGSEPVLEEEEE